MHTSSPQTRHGPRYSIMGVAISISLLTGIATTAALPIRDIPRAAPGTGGMAYEDSGLLPLSAAAGTGVSLNVTHTEIPMPACPPALTGEMYEGETGMSISSPGADLTDIMSSLNTPEIETFSSIGFVWEESRISWETENSVPVPEPGTLTLIVLAGGGMIVIGRWKQRIAGRIRVVTAAVRLPAPDTRARDARLRQVGLMTGEMLHDLKNVLTGIRTCALVLSEDGLTGDERAEFRQLIEAELERGGEMIQDVLDFFAGREPVLRLEPYDLRDLLREVAVTLERQWAGEPVAILTHLEATGPVRLDVHKMKRVLLNLAANAHDAMPEGGDLTLCSSRCGDTVRIEVQDTGCGMSPQLRKRIFDPFITEGKAHGTGLGLAITRDIVEGHHGRIDVQSAVGYGTTVSLTLPAIQFQRRTYNA